MTLPRWLGPGAVAFVAVWLLLLAGGRSAFFKDPGTFWHVATGERVLADGFLRADPYTFTFAGTWWVPYQWLGEVGMALGHRAGGFDALLLGAVTIVAAVFAWLAARLLGTGLHPVLAGAVVALALAAAGSHFHVRPHLVTLAFMAVVLGLLTAADAPRPRLNRLFALVPLCAVWTNVHGGVLGGIGTVGTAFAGWVGFRALGLPSPVATRRDALVLAAVALGCGLSTFASPYGPDMLRTWKVIMGAPELRDVITEHRPLDVTAPYAWPVLGLAGAYLFVLAGAAPRGVRVAWLLPLVWLALTFDRCRHASLFAVAAVVAITAVWPHTRWARWLAAHRPDLYQPAPGAPRPWWAHVWLPAAAVALALGLQVARVPVPLVGRGWAVHDPDDWPVGVLDALKAREPKPGAPNKLFNSGYVDGGFVIYHAPGYKVFVDDRCEVFGGPWLKEFSDAERSPDPGPVLLKWEARYGPYDFALTRTATPIDDWFAASPAWRAVKVTPTATFYERR